MKSIGPLFCHVTHHDGTPPYAGRATTIIQYSKMFGVEDGGEKKYERTTPPPTSNTSTRRAKHKHAKAMD